MHFAQTFNSTWTLSLRRLRSDPLHVIHGMCNDEAVIWLYRQHPSQVTRKVVWRQRSEVGRRIALQRIQAVRSLQAAIGATQLPSLEVAGGAPVSVSPPQKVRGKDDYL